MTSTASTTSVPPAPRSPILRVHWALNPALAHHQCALPISLASQLFAAHLRPGETVATLREAIPHHAVLLWRKPILQRADMRALRPVLMDAPCLQLHPLTIHSLRLNLDEAVYLYAPLSIKAQAEARLLADSPYPFFSAAGRSLFPPDLLVALYYLTMAPSSKLQRKPFPTTQHVLTALNAGAISLHQPLLLRTTPDQMIFSRPDFPSAPEPRVHTTAGRVLFNSLLPAQLPFFNLPITPAIAKQLLADCRRQLGHAAALDLLERLSAAASLAFSRSGISIAIPDIRIPSNKPAVLASAQKRHDRIDKNLSIGAITEREQYGALLEIWKHAADTLGDQALDEVRNDHRLSDGTPAAPNDPLAHPTPNLIHIMREAGGILSSQYAKLAAMVGQFPQASGEIFPVGCTASLREGLSPLEMFCATIYARKTLINAYFIRQGGAILQKLARAARHVHIAELDCRTRDGLRKTVRYRGLEVWRPLADSIVGRASCASLTHPLTGATVVNDGDIISLEQAQQIEALGIDSWVVRSPVTCRSKAGICAKCYGADLSTDTLVRPGARVGIIAAQTLGDALSRFHPIISVRTFHTGAIAYSVSAFHAGTITYHNLRIAEVPDDGKTIRRVLSRDAVVVISDQGREVQREKIPYGATLLVSEGDLVRPFQRLAESSPWITSLYAETAGTVSLENIDPSTSEIDRESLTPRLKISDHDGRRRPLVRILDPATGTPLSFHFLPIGARLHVSHGQSVIPGQAIAACMRPSGSRDFDTATGIPRVIELLEAQNPRDHAILAEASGIVEVIAEPGTYRNMELRVKDSDGVSFQHRIPIASILRVHSGDFVSTGDALIDGPASPHDLLRLRGTKGLCDYMLTELADAFGIQSLEVDEKHLEIILRQMLQQPGVVQPLSKISRHRDVGTYPDPLN